MSATVESRDIGHKIAHPGEWAVRTRWTEEIAKCEDLQFAMTVADALVKAGWSDWASVEDWDTLHGPEVQYLVGDRCVYDADMDMHKALFGHVEKRTEDCIDRLR